MWEVGFTYNHFGCKSETDLWTKKELWCRRCLEHFSFLPITKTPQMLAPVQEVVPPTMEDLIRAIFREEIENQRGE
jgi:hypothetical protein